MLALAQEHVRIGDDLVVTLQERAAASTSAATYHDGTSDYLLVRTRPNVAEPSRPERATRRARRWAVLFDTSASRSPANRKAQETLVERAIHEFDDDDQATFIAFDHRPRVFGRAGPVRELDVRRAISFLKEESKEGVGDTDLGAALDAALDALGPANATEHVVLYVGDGMVTRGEGRAAVLAEKLAGKAMFVGVAVGDRADHRLLGQLAAATSGLTVTVNPGDDLAWRAFDLVATLNTPRLLGLTATLTDAAGNPDRGAHLRLAFRRRRRVGSRSRPGRRPRRTSKSSSGRRRTANRGRA